MLKINICKNGTIEEVNLGLTLNLLPKTPLTDNLKKYGLVQETKHINNWICKSNPDLDYKERLRRRIYLQPPVEQLGYKVFEAKNYTKQLFSSWNEVLHIKQQAQVIEDFKYDRDQGGLVATNKSSTATIKIYANKNTDSSIQFS